MEKNKVRTLYQKWKLKYFKALHPKDLKETHVSPRFIAALFTIAKTQKQPRRPSVDEWIGNCDAYTQWNITQL